MNWETVKGNWKQFKGKVKEQWGDLTDDHLDQIDGTTHVRRLTRSYIIEDHQKEPIPFDIKATKTSRVSLVDPDSFAIHIQDTVYFYEAITYRRLSYIDHPLEPYQDIVRIRDI